jgi:phosphoadenosine phosphosulfate reductase
MSEARAAILDRSHAAVRPADLVRAMILAEFPGRIAVSSSFGTESAVLLHMVAAVDPATPVLVLDTGKLFGETRRYRDLLVARLGLTDVRAIAPEPLALAARDGKGVLWSQDPDACCALRKVEPLQRALAPFAAWFTGRKAFQAATRAQLPLVEFADGRFKINPLATMTAADIAAYFRDHDLPRHPLEAEGYRSIGCMPCTGRVAPGEDARAGRWRGRGKTECGIHRPTARAS